MRAFAIAIVATCWATMWPQSSNPYPSVAKIPRTWDDAAIETLEIPLVAAAGSPRHISADYYYRIPVRPIYRSYDVFAPGHEPAGYMDRLRQLEPVLVWDGQRHHPPLRTEADWIRAGEIVFDSAVVYDGITTAADVAQESWYVKTGVLVTKGGVMPFYRYVIRQRGKLELGRLSCASCHTRVMPDGTTLKGAQGNFAFDEARAYAFRSGRFQPEVVRALERALFATPWLKPDPNAKTDRLTTQEIAAAHASIPPGVLGRHRSSVYYPVQVPDLTGVRDRRYLDRTGLQQHRSIVDLMRYAALNQGADDLASFGGFVPADFPEFSKLPEPTDPRLPGRYSEEQLYALALYLYSLQPPHNPNRFDDAARRGQMVFQREGCGGCHTPPLYTNNKLTPADGFTIPADHASKYEILAIRVGTDAGLAMHTRRGTGYYKVPSLKGLWYRSMFPHDGACATLEDWFDPRRMEDNYAPTGFKENSVERHAVKGHPFGLNLKLDEKRSLVAFLRTL